MDADSFLAEASELLAIPSTADRPGDLRRALDFVLDSVGPGVTVEHFESGGKPSALLYAGGARTDFRVILNAHLDVVPAPADQFRPRRDGDRLFARGAQDMKVSALLEARVFRELAGQLPYPVALQLVTDEEVGGRDGTWHQLQRGVRGRFVIIGETSGLRIVTESKGIVTVTLTAAGLGAHSAYQWLGDNALVKLERSVGNLLARYPVATEEAWRTTVTLARVATQNQARNQVPADAEAWLDIRYPADDGDFSGKTAEEITTYLAGFCEPGVTPLVDRLDQPHHTDPDHPDVLRLQQAARSQGYSGDFLRKHGAGDGRFYGQLGMAAVAFGVDGSGQHGPQEYADITTIAPYYRALTEFLTSLKPLTGSPPYSSEPALARAIWPLQRPVPQIVPDAVAQLPGLPAVQDSARGGAGEQRAERERAPARAGGQAPPKQPGQRGSRREDHAAGNHRNATAMRPRRQVGTHPLGQLPGGRRAVRLVQFRDELDLDPDHDQRLGDHFGGEGGQHGQRRDDPGRSPGRGGGAGRAFDEGVSDLFRRLARELRPQRRLVTYPQPRRHRDHLSDQVAGARVRAPPHRRRSRPRAAARCPRSAAHCSRPGPRPGPSPAAHRARPAAGRART